MQNIANFRLLAGSVNKSAFGTRQLAMIRKGSLTGKAVVLKTTGLSPLQVRVLSLPPSHCQFQIPNFQLIRIARLSLINTS
jgi:hypothetical protein